MQNSAIAVTHIEDTNLFLNRLHEQIMHKKVCCYVGRNMDKTFTYKKTRQVYQTALCKLQYIITEATLSVSYYICRMHNK